MLQLNINEVKTHISATISKVMAGEAVISCKRNKPVVELRAIAPENTRRLEKRIAGYGARKYPDFKLPDNFNDSLPDEILTYFTGAGDGK